MKVHILNATTENKCQLSNLELDTFIGIIIFSAINKRESQRDYWSTDPYLSCEVVKSTMSSIHFKEIKSKIKYSKSLECKENNKAWPVRYILKKFCENIRQFGYFKTGLSIDESTVKSYARTSLKQFIPKKPIRFRLKFWSLCTSDGYLLNCDLFCEKNTAVGNNELKKLALGSRVVMSQL